jgi:hypothetical protein
MTSPDPAELAATAAPDELAAWRAESEPSSAPPEGDATPPRSEPDTPTAASSEDRAARKDDARPEEDRDAAGARLPGSPDAAWADEKPQHQTDG